MSVDKFKFVSPGVFIDEIDESGIPSLPERMGPLIIGRFQKGPSNRPIRIDSFKEFVQIYGNPAPGRPGRDTWRSAESTAPTYAAYAAQAWLRNNSPCTIYRVLGENRSDAEARATYPESSAGWNTADTFDSTTIADVGGAYGLFVMPNPDSYPSVAATATITVSATDVANIGEGDTIKLISTDGTTVTLTMQGQAGSTTSEATSGATLTAKTLSAGSYGSAALHATAQAVEIKTAINYHTLFSATNSSNEITATQAAQGPLGSTVITITELGATGLTKTDFTGGTHHAVTGTLAAVWYVEGGAVVLSGTARDGTQKQGAGVLIKGDGGVKFKAKILNTSNAVAKTATFTFDRDADTYVRKVFNTDPTKTNSAIYPDSAGTELTYWLGETFESNVVSAENSKLAVTGAIQGDTTDMVGVILALDGGNHDDSTIAWSDHIQETRPAQTGWFISQDTRGPTTSSFNPLTDTEKLFKFHALDSGAHANKDFKISIRDIKVPSDNFNNYGTFTVQVRQASDLDSRPTVLEQFTGLNLDPTSANYISRVIGDKYYTFNSSNKTLVEHNTNDNVSKLIRVEVAPLVEDGNATPYNPFGVYGPYVPKSHEVATATTASIVACGSGSSGCLPFEALVANDGTYGHEPGVLFHGNRTANRTSPLDITASIAWPTTRLRLSSSEGNSVVGTRAYFGYQSHLFGTKRYDHTNVDLLRGQPAAVDPTTSSNTLKQPSWVFTLDDVKPDPNDTGSHATWLSGSRADGTSFTALSASGDANNKPYVLSQGYNKFTSPMFGGFDGFDITEQDPFRNTYLATNQSEKKNYAFFSIKKAIDIISDSEFVEFDLLTIPGLTNSTLNTQLVNTCEERGDALAIIDLDGGYLPPHDRSGAETAAATLGSVDSTVNKLKSLGINSSYGCAFYPFVRIRDTINDAVLLVPPSVVALGTFSSSQRKSAVWFAPAGFTRGGLSEGSAGLPVIGVRQRLTSEDRDNLYDANINPIASFPAEGLVIFGQKTLQVTPSALDRINVRRLLIYLKKEISRIASRILFDQNVQSTWDRFTGQVVPFLEGVQAGLGLMDFKVVLDDTTTTPDLIDRNILYAKIFLKPARAIEFIALDFIITRTGASFDD